MELASGEENLAFRESRIQKALLDGDKQAVNDIHNLYGETLAKRLELHWGNRLGDSSLLCDLVQETWVQILTKRGTYQFRGEAAFMGWITRIGSNLCAGALRERKRLARILKEFVSGRKRWQQQDLGELGERKFPAMLADEERWERFRRAFRALPRLEQRAIYSTQLEQRSSAEVADELRMSRARFYTLLWRAHERLRKLYGGSSTSMHLPWDKELTPPPGEPPDGKG